MTDLFADVAEPQLGKLKKRKQPRWITPMKAVLTDDHFSDPNWIFEPKFEGERCLVFKTRDSVTLLSRNKKKINESYPEIVEALVSQHGDLVLDGEIVAFDNDAPSFARLQRRALPGSSAELCPAGRQSGRGERASPSSCISSTSCTRMVIRPSGFR